MEKTTSIILSLFVLAGISLRPLDLQAAAETNSPAASGVEPPAGETVSTGVLKEEPILVDDDKRITDLELRAQAGSRSRYSLKFIFGYSGPQINRLDKEAQPNPNNSPGRHLTNVSGSVGLRYRLSPSEALYLSSGVRAYTPFSGLQDEEINDPSLSYDNTYRLGSVQGRSSVWTAITTTEDYLRRGQVAASGLSQAFKFRPDNSRWTVGTNLSLSFYHFQRGYEQGDGKVSNYYFNFIPSVEYQLRDGLNFNTSVAFPMANLRRSGDWTELTAQLASQRVGLGWAITREIYFNPYIGFYPQRPSWDNASLSFNTIFSIF